VNVPIKFSSVSTVFCVVCFFIIFYTIYSVYFSYKYCTENPLFSIALSQFGTIKENENNLLNVT
jgi:hypothetical protein